MPKTPISTTKAPPAASFFSQAILSSCKYRLEIAGQIALNPETGKFIKGDVKEQTIQTFQNIKGILAELGWNLSHVTKARVYLISMDHYQMMNEVYQKQFTQTPPARICVAVKELPLGALVEIECLAEGDKVELKETKKLR
jgi:2-iminobutanoate/2-iminopropanoate deaminase